jgi:ubiquinone/menaquinone biosynthesis C-methylase UbiE
MSIGKEFLVGSNRAQVNSETDSFTPDRYRQMFAHFPRAAAKVLDSGCNTGRGGAVLKVLKPELEVVGVDCLQERIAQLDLSVYKRGICSLSTQLPLENDALDVIVAGEFIEHVPPADTEATLAEFFRVLRLRGRLILTTPNPNYLRNKLCRFSVLSEKSHLTQHYPECLRFRLRMVGFSSVKIYGSGRMTRYIGQRFPWRSLYGSYLVRADKW